MKTLMRYSLLCLGLMNISCREDDVQSSLSVTSIEQSPVKQQSTGNCWIYAAATWLESLMKSTSGETVDVSESYWTYWDIYSKLMDRQIITGKDFDMGGSWSMSSFLIERYGWVREADFIQAESNSIASNAQACAEKYITAQSRPGGTLYNPNMRSEALVHNELARAFSCNGRYRVNMNAAFAKRRSAEATMLRDAKTGQMQSLSSMLRGWQQVEAPTVEGTYTGKKLISENEVTQYRALEQRIKRALNDRHPVMIAFHVSFNAVDQNGLFSLDSLGAKGTLGEGGGHMVVLDDYTVTQVPSGGSFISLGEGDLDMELKNQAILGQMNYVVAKNSWGYNRSDRPWLHNGYSRFTWDYLQNRYWEEEKQLFVPFLHAVILPSGY